MWLVPSGLDCVTPWNLPTVFFLIYFNLFFLIFLFCYGHADVLQLLLSNKTYCKEHTWTCSLWISLGVELLDQSLCKHLVFPEVPEGIPEWSHHSTLPSHRERGFVRYHIPDDYFTLFSNLQLSSFCQGIKCRGTLLYFF